MKNDKLLGLHGQHSNILLYLHANIHPTLLWMDGTVFYVPPTQYTTGYTGDRFYRSKDPTNSIKILKGHIQYINNRKIH